LPYTKLVEVRSNHGGVGVLWPSTRSRIARALLWPLASFLTRSYTVQDN
jgi:hypothetical protein